MSSGKEIAFRYAKQHDITAITELILVEGPTVEGWNYLVKDEVERHVAAIALGKTEAAVATCEGLIGGVATYETGRFYPEYQPDGRALAVQGYIAEVVVAESMRGMGVAPKLLELAFESLYTRRIKEVYAKRHADNYPSGRMMRKAGMRDIATFDDPIRTTGSGKTTVSRIVLGTNRIPVMDELSQQFQIAGERKRAEERGGQADIIDLDKRRNNPPENK